LNIKYLVERENIGQDQFGEMFDLKRGTIGSYISRKAIPKLETMQKISAKYGILIDDIVSTDLSKGEGDVLKSDNVRVTSSNLPESELILSLRDQLKDKERIIAGLERERELMEKYVALIEMNAKKKQTQHSLQERISQTNVTKYLPNIKLL
jgi:transcriptional regulator with XRE-family HTH domain